MSFLTPEERAALDLPSIEGPDRLEADHGPAPDIDPRTVACRWSNLKAFNDSAAHYRHRVQRDGEASASMRKGSALHSLLLGNQDAVIEYSGRRAGKAWESFKADQNPNAEILIASEMGAVREMRAAIERHRPSSGPSAVELLSEGVKEQRIDWTAQGKACHGTPDVVGRRGVELKSTRSANPRWFLRDAERMLYHGQCAWYDNVTSPPDGWWIVAVESVPPFNVTVFRVDDAVLDVGRLLAARFFAALLECERTGVWDGYATAPVPWETVWGMGDGGEIGI